jgi:hypothetical protein
VRPIDHRPSIGNGAHDLGALVALLKESRRQPLVGDQNGIDLQDDAREEEPLGEIQGRVGGA